MLKNIHRNTIQGPKIFWINYRPYYTVDKNVEIRKTIVIEMSIIRRGHVVKTEDVRNEQKNLAGKTERKRMSGRTDKRRHSMIKQHFKEMGFFSLVRFHDRLPMRIAE